MKKTHLFVPTCLLLFALMLFTTCEGQEKPNAKIQPDQELFSFIDSPTTPQIAAYIRHIFQDENGNFWFGTNGEGAVHYDGNRLHYFSNEEGFGGQQITGITADQEGNIWFATDQGIVKYDGATTKEGKKQFTNYSAQQYFEEQRFWSICSGRDNTIWAGSARGIFHFDGTSWKPFELPYPKKMEGGFINGGTSCSIIEDSAGNMWFSTRGHGVFKYDGTQFIHYTEQDGLANNDVYDIFEDSKGKVWFGTMFGGLSCFDGIQFVNYNRASGTIRNNEVCIIYEDQAGNIWFSSEGYGVYRYNGDSFANFSREQGLGVGAVQAIFEDQDGRIWVGGGGGLYRYDGASFISVTKDGPWR